jgi:hypothetical protein
MIARRLTCDERGVAAVEFAITSPVYFLMLFGLARQGCGFGRTFRFSAQSTPPRAAPPS